MMFRSGVVLGALVATILFATGCGGGNSSRNSSNSSSNSGETQRTTAQGVYEGTTSNGYSFQTIVLPNDKAYAIYGMSGSVFTIYGMMTGQGTSNNGSFTANLKDYYWTGATYSATLTSSYVAGSSLNGTISESGSSFTFTGTAIPSSLFNYNTPAAISTLVGNWTGESLDGSFSTVTVNSTGTVSGTSAGCSFSGNVTPDTSKNFYNVSLTFGGSPCLTPNQSASGVAITYLLSNGVTRQLVVAGTTSGGMGNVFVATK